MKSIYFLALACVLLFGTLHAQNLIVNGDFETGSKVPWLGYNNAITTEVQDVNNSTDYCYSGTTSGRISNGAGSLYQVVTLTSGTDYTLTFYGKLRDAGQSFSAAVKEESTGNVLDNGTISVNSNAWVKYTINFTAPASENVRVVFYKGNGISPFYLDEVVLSIADNTPKDNFYVLFENFENYADNLALGAAQGFESLSGNSIVTNSVDAYDGAKFMVGTPTPSPYFLRKTLPIQANMPYIFEAMTKSPNGSAHQLQVELTDGTNTRTINGTTKTNTDWEKSKVSFVPNSNETTATFIINGIDADAVWVDDMIAFMAVTTSNQSAEIASFSVAPNPSNGLFNISTQNEIKAVMVYNTVGQIIHQQNGLNKKTLQINITNYNNGAYILQVSYNNGQSSVQKIILQ